MGKKSVPNDDSSSNQQLVQHDTNSRTWDHGMFVPKATSPQSVAPFDLITVEFASVTKATAKQVLAEELATVLASCPPPNSGDGDAD